jgi:hypothetical protein
MVNSPIASYQGVTEQAALTGRSRVHIFVLDRHNGLHLVIIRNTGLLVGIRSWVRKRPKGIAMWHMTWYIYFPVTRWT